MGDKRLSAADFRVLAAIAYYDRFGRNGLGCYVDPRRLAERAGIDPAHLARHTRRLEQFGYLIVEQAEIDRRRRIYRVVYDHTAEIATNAGDKRAEIVTNPDFQTAENKRKTPAHKRSRKTRLRDPAKPPEARQGKARAPAVPRQRELRMMQDVSAHNRQGRLNAAEGRLGNDLIGAGLVEPLEKTLGVSLAGSKAYAKAIQCEDERHGTGCAYLRAVLRKRASSPKRR